MAPRAARRRPRPAAAEAEAPAGTPAHVLEKISKEMARSLGAPDLRERLTNHGAEPMSMTPGQFDKFVRSEMDDAARIVKAARISAQ